MKKFFVALFTAILLLISYGVVSFINYNSDESRIKRIDKYFESTYNATFEYAGKEKRSYGEVLYFFKMKENNAVIVTAQAQLYDHSGMSVVPFYVAPDEWGHIDEDFTDVLYEYIVEKDCNNQIDLKQMSLSEAIQKIYYTLSDVTEQMNYYIKNNDKSNNSIALSVIYDKYKERIEFDKLNKEDIEDKLYEFTENYDIECQ